MDDKRCGLDRGVQGHAQGGLEREASQAGLARRRPHPPARVRTPPRRDLRSSSVVLRCCFLSRVASGAVRLQSAKKQGRKEGTAGEDMAEKVALLTEAGCLAGTPST